MDDTLIFAGVLVLLLAFVGGLVSGRRSPRRRLR